ESSESGRCGCGEENAKGLTAVVRGFGAIGRGLAACIGAGVGTRRVVPNGEGGCGTTAPPIFISVPQFGQRADCPAIASSNCREFPHLQWTVIIAENLGAIELAASPGS